MAGSRGIMAWFIFHVGVSQSASSASTLVSGVVLIAGRQRWPAWSQPGTSGMQLNKVGITYPPD